jgi:DNA mismatch repair ATPase MutS
VFNVLKKLEKKRNDIQVLFEYIGDIDSAISIATIRNEAPYYCKPVIVNDKKTLNFTDIYHPLITDCVSNSLNIRDKSILLTGSNMSGKTTFIRTVGINVLLAQTINTCFAKTLILSPMRVFSAIRISDDLLNNTSYYFEEVKLVKNLIDESNSLLTNLFLLDEIFKGTNTIERLSAGKAILSYFAKSTNNIVFVSTHDMEFTELLYGIYDLYHFTELIQNNDIYFDYKLKSGAAYTTNAIKILEINNYPLSIIEDAQKTASLLQK